MSHIITFVRSETKPLLKHMKFFVVFRGYSKDMKEFVLSEMAKVWSSFTAKTRQMVQKVFFEWSQALSITPPLLYLIFLAVHSHLWCVIWASKWRKIIYTTKKREKYPPITYYWTGLLILDHSYLVVNLTNSKIAETKALEPLKSWRFFISNFWTCSFPNEIWVVQD